MADVAAAAGVSLSTASLAFSGNKPVSEETRHRVLAAAGALGYAGPNPLARNLRRGRSSQELAAATWRGARATPQQRCFFQRQLAVRKTRADRLYRAGVFAFFGRQRHATRHQHTR